MPTISLISISILISFMIGVGIILFVLYNELQSIKLMKRFDRFSLCFKAEEEPSFFDRFFHFLWKIVHKFSTLLKKSSVLTRYQNRYEKYISFKDKEKQAMDIISIKFLVGFLFFFLYLFFIILRHLFFTPIAFLAFLFGFFLPDIILNIQFQKRKKQVREDLLKAIIIMNNSFKSGKNIMQAISTVKNELTGQVADEFKKIYLDMTYGLSLEDVFSRFYERISLEETKYIASSLTLLNKTGGNIVEVFSTIEKSFFTKKKMQDELHSLTSASVFVFRILIFLPFVFIGIILLLNPTYFAPLFQSFLGWVLFSFILILYILYIVIVKKVLKVKI